LYVNICLVGDQQCCIVVIYFLFTFLAFQMVQPLSCLFVTVTVNRKTAKIILKN